MSKPSLGGKPGRVSLHVVKKSTRVDAVPVVLRTCLTEQDLRDLHVIWGRDQRIPTPGSRQKWSHHRGLAPATVGGWFTRRRARHIRQAGDEAGLAGSYELNPSSPSNVVPHEIPVKVQVRGSRARARARTERGANFGSGSERTDPDQSSDDPAFYHLGGLDQEVNLGHVAETVTITSFGSGEALPPPGPLCRGDCLLCQSAPPSPPTLRLPWSMQVETARQSYLGLGGIGVFELFPTSEFAQELEQRPTTPLDIVYSTTV